MVVIVVSVQVEWKKERRGSCAKSLPILECEFIKIETELTEICLLALQLKSELGEDGVCVR